MARKRIADKDPVLSPEGAAAAAPAKAPATAKAPAANKARAPRASATAVTHRHKKSQGETPVSPAEREIPTSVAVTETIEVVGETETLAPALTHAEVEFRAYLLAESRGFSNGTPEQDWLEAERQLIAEQSIRQLSAGARPRD